MALKTVTGKVSNAGPAAPISPTVWISLSQPAVITGTQEVLSAPIPATVATDGTYSVQLQANGDLTPSTTYYTVTESVATGTVPQYSTYQFTIVVPQTAGPFVMSNIATPPPALGPAWDADLMHLSGAQIVTGVKLLANLVTPASVGSGASGTGVGGIDAQGTGGDYWRWGTGLGSGWINGTNGVRGDSIASDTGDGVGASFYNTLYSNMIGFADKGSANAHSFYGQINPYSGGGDVYGELGGVSGRLTCNCKGALVGGFEITVQNLSTRGGRTVGFTGVVQENNAVIDYWSRGLWLISNGSNQASEAIRVEGTAGWSHLLRLIGTDALDKVTINGAGHAVFSAGIDLAGTGNQLIFNSARAAGTGQLAFLAAVGGNDVTLKGNNDGTLHSTGPFVVDSLGLTVVGGGNAAIIGDSNISGAIPASRTLGFAIASNFDSGTRDVGIFNLDTLATTSFEFRQKTGASISALLMTLFPNGDAVHLRGAAFWGHAVVGSQPATPVTLADVIAIIRGCGLAA